MFAHTFDVWQELQLRLLKLLTAQAKNVKVSKC